MASRRDRWRGVPRTAERARFWQDWRARQPRFLDAVLADARMAARHRGEDDAVDGVLDAVVLVARLCIVTDAFVGQVLYRAKVACQVRRIPLVPRLLHRMAISQAQICIGDPVVIAAGVYLPHGQVVIDGLTVIERRCVVAPFTTIGLIAGAFQGPTLREGVFVGTGVRVLGPYEIGRGAHIGANAVVTGDVAAGAVVGGVPAKPIGRGATG